MNTGLKHWKEAATVILAAGTRLRPAFHSLKISEISSPPNFTKSDFAHKSVFDYEVLLLKRSSKSVFLPNNYVFPGGVVEHSDFSSDWLETFKSVRQLPNFGLGFVKQETRPPIFATDRQKLGSPITSDVAFRICAVRETFEESGILLVVPKNEESNITDTTSQSGDNNVTTPLTRSHELCSNRELARWRSLVIEDPWNFIRMCRELDCMPNIWAMNEWGNWLTPKSVGGNRRRYDTAFFICCLQEIPPTVQDEKEIVHFQWSSPYEVLQNLWARELNLSPPQVYELGRMCHFSQLQDLHSFARARAPEGCEWFRPIELRAADCFVYLLPGDELYPENLDPLEDGGVILSTEKSFEQLQQESSTLHRFKPSNPISFHMSITPKHNHLLPIGASFQTSSSTHKSQL